MSDRPAPIRVDKVSIRAVRGPHPDGSGRWYWRADKSIGKRQREIVWQGWELPDTVAREVMKVLTGRPPTVTQGDVQTIHDLLDCWTDATVSTRTH